MFVAVREAAKEGPSTGLFRIFRSALRMAPLAGPMAGPDAVRHGEWPDRGREGRAWAAQRLSLPSKGRSVQPGQEAEVVSRGTARSRTTGRPRRDLPRLPDRELAMRTR